MGRSLATFANEQESGVTNSIQPQAPQQPAQSAATKAATTEAAKVLGEAIAQVQRESWVRSTWSSS